MLGKYGNTSVPRHVMSRANVNRTASRTSEIRLNVSKARIMISVAWINTIIHDCVESEVRRSVGYPTKPVSRYSI